MKILYLITARAGSKGLPNKNIKPLHGKPLFLYSVDFALENMTKNDELCISTNDESLISIASNLNINIPFKRPDNLASDTANSTDVIHHAVDFYQNQGKIFDAVLLLQPTSPLRTKDDFKNLMKAFTDDCDMAVSVKISKENPYFSLFEEDEQGFLYKSKKGDFQRRQDCPEVYSYNGSMYLIRISSLKKSKLSEFKKIKKILMPEERSVDIDTMADWILAEYYLTKEKNE